MLCFDKLRVVIGGLWKLLWQKLQINSVIRPRIVLLRRYCLFCFVLVFLPYFCMVSDQNKNMLTVCASLYWWDGPRRRWKSIPHRWSPAFRSKFLLHCPWFLPSALSNWFSSIEVSNLLFLALQLILTWICHNHCIM